MENAFRNIFENLENLRENINEVQDELITQTIAVSLVTYVMLSLGTNAITRAYKFFNTTKVIVEDDNDEDYEPSESSCDCECECNNEDNEDNEQEKVDDSCDEIKQENNDIIDDLDKYLRDCEAELYTQECEQHPLLNLQVETPYSYYDNINL